MSWIAGLVESFLMLLDRLRPAPAPHMTPMRPTHEARVIISIEEARRRKFGGQ